MLCWGRHWKGNFELLGFRYWDILGGYSLVCWAPHIRMCHVEVALGNKIRFIEMSSTHQDVLRFDIGMWIFIHWATHRVMIHQCGACWKLGSRGVGNILVQCWVSVGWFGQATVSRRRTDVDPLISVHEYFARL